MPQTIYGLGVFYPGLMHTKCPGTGQVLLGACASWISKKILPMPFDKNLEHLLESLKACHKQHGDKETQGDWKI